MTEKKISLIAERNEDLELLAEGAQLLEQFAIPHELRRISAHLNPREMHAYALGAEERGIEVIIAAASGAAHLAGTIASLTTLPVIGVPLESSLSGLDSLFSTVQMPAGIPVATMAIGRAGVRNACLFAAQILALRDRTLHEKIIRHRRKMEEEVIKKGEKLREGGYRNYRKN